MGNRLNWLHQSIPKILCLNLKTKLLFGNSASFFKWVGYQKYRVPYSDSVFKWGTWMNFGNWIDITWLDLIFYCLANRWARKAYRLLWGGVPNPWMTKHIRVDVKKTHIIRNNSAVAISTSLRSITLLVRCIILLMPKTAGKQKQVHGWTICHLGLRGRVPEWPLFLVCTARPSDVLIVDGHGIRTNPKIIHAAYLNLIMIFPPDSARFV